MDYDEYTEEKGRELQFLTKSKNPEIVKRHKKTNSRYSRDKKLSKSYPRGNLDYTDGLEHEKKENEKRKNLKMQIVELSELLDLKIDKRKRVNKIKKRLKSQVKRNEIERTDRYEKEEILSEEEGREWKPTTSNRAAFDSEYEYHSDSSYVNDSQIDFNQIHQSSSFHLNIPSNIIHYKDDLTNYSRHIPIHLISPPPTPPLLAARPYPYSTFASSSISPFLFSQTHSPTYIPQQKSRNFKKFRSTHSKSGQYARKSLLKKTKNHIRNHSFNNSMILKKKGSRKYLTGGVIKGRNAKFRKSMSQGRTRLKKHYAFPLDDWRRQMSMSRINEEIEIDFHNNVGYYYVKKKGSKNRKLKIPQFLTKSTKFNRMTGKRLAFEQLSAIMKGQALKRKGKKKKKKKLKPKPPSFPKSKKSKERPIGHFLKSLEKSNTGESNGLQYMMEGVFTETATPSQRDSLTRVKQTPPIPESTYPNLHEPTLQLSPFSSSHFLNSVQPNSKNKENYSRVKKPDKIINIDTFPISPYQEITKLKVYQPKYQEVNIFIFLIVILFLLL